MTEAKLRDSILAFVKKYPGVHPRELERQMGLPTKLANYHLEALESEGLVQRIEDTGYARYLSVSAVRAISKKDLRFILLLRRGPPLRLILILLAHGAQSAGALAEHLSLPKASLSYHLQALLEARVVTMEKRGRERYYELADADYVQGLLEDFEPLPGVLDEFSSVWNDLVG